MKPKKEEKIQICHNEQNTWLQVNLYRSKPGYFSAIIIYQRSGIIYYLYKKGLPCDLQKTLTYTWEEIDRNKRIGERGDKRLFHKGFIRDMDDFLWGDRKTDKWIK